MRAKLKNQLKKRLALLLAVLMVLSMGVMMDWSSFLLPKANASSGGNYSIKIWFDVYDTDSDSDFMRVTLSGVDQSGSSGTILNNQRYEDYGRNSSYTHTYSSEYLPTSINVYWESDKCDKSDFGARVYVYVTNNGETQLMCASLSDHTNNSGDDTYSCSGSDSTSTSAAVNSVSITGGGSQTCYGNYNTTITSSAISAAAYDQFGVKWYQDPTWSTDGDSLSTTSNSSSVTLSSSSHSDHTSTVTASLGGKSASTNVTYKWKHRLTVAGTATGGTSNTTYEDYSGSTKSLSAGNKTGYTFSSWSKSGTGSLSTTSSSSTTWTWGNGDGTATANWTINSSTLSVNPNGGTWSGNTSSQSFTQNYNTTKAIANPTPPSGQHFTGWTLSSGANGSFSNGTYTFGPTKNVTDTLTANYANHTWNSGSVTTQPTCTAAGVKTYTCTYSGCGATYTESVSALGHTWGTPTYSWASNNSTVTATRVCGRDSSHKETETVNTTTSVVTSPTCEGSGVTKYTATFTNSAFATQTKNVTVNALGHSWGTPTYSWTTDNSQVTATRVCSRDSNHVQTETVNTTSSVITSPTCEGNGSTKYTATFSNSAFSTQTKTVTVNALGHQWDYAHATFNWNGYACATATVKCSRNQSHTITVDTTVTSEVITPATCTTAGSKKYTATFTVGSTNYTSTKTETLNALNHNWSAWASANGREERTCSRCNLKEYRVTGTFNYMTATGSATSSAPNNTGTGVPLNVTIPSAPSTVTKNSKSYSLQGWSTGNNLNNTVAATGSVSLNANATYYAVYQVPLTLSYNANGGSNAPASHNVTGKANYNASTHSGTFTVSSDVPTRDGYNFLGWSTDQNATAATISAGGSYTASALNTTLYAVWQERSDIQYKVNHYQQNVTGTDYTLKETTTYNDGHVNGSITLADKQKTYTGFTYSYGTLNGSTTHVTTAAIAANGSLQVNLYYDRVTTTVTPAAGTGVASVSGGGTIRYEGTGSVTATVKPGYTFENWTSSNTAAVAGGTGATYSYTANATGGSATLTANARANTNTAYTVYYYLQNIDDDNYTLQAASGEGKTGTTDTAVLYSTLTKDITGFVYQYGGETNSASGLTAAQQKTESNIAGDGSTKIYLYYDRTTTTVNLVNGNTAGITAVSGGGTYRYGKSVTVTATLKAGYGFANWVSSDTTVVADGTAKSYTFTIDKAGTVTLTANATAQSVAYTVKHYKEKVDGSGYDEVTGDQVNGSAVTDSSLTVASFERTYDGFSTKEVKINGTVSTAAATTVLGDGSLEIAFYYDRNQYTVTFTAGTGIAAVSAGVGGAALESGVTTVRYGATVSLGASVKDGYTWSKWESGTAGFSDVSAVNGTFMMPDHAVSLTATATANTNTVYTVNYYRQKIGGVGYDLVAADSGEKTGTTDTQVTLASLVKTYEGFTYAQTEVNGSVASEATATILGDGSRLIELYYTRNTYTLTFTAGTGIASVTATASDAAVNSGAEVYYGAPVVLTATLKDGYTTIVYTGDVTTSSFSMPANAVSVTASATAQTVPFTVKRYQLDTAGNYPAAGSTVANTQGVTDTDITIADYYGDYNADVFEIDYVKINGTVSDAATTTVLGDGSRLIEIYYARKQYTVTFSAGTGTENAAVTANSAAIASGDAVYADAAIALNADVKAGYTWSKWVSGTNGFSDVSARDGSFTMPAKNITLTATATANADTVYKVNYYRQGLDGAYAFFSSPANTKAATDTDVNIAQLIADGMPAEGFSYDHTTVSRHDAAAADYAGDTVNLDGDGKLVINVYYARDKYVLTFTKGDGIDALTAVANNAAAASGDEVFYGAQVTLSATLLPGYQTLVYGGDFTTASFTMPADDVSVTASASEIPYTVSFDADGGAAVSSMNYTVTSTDTLPGCSKTGYDFDGWTPKSDAGSWSAAQTYTAGTSLTGKYGTVELKAQ